MNNNNSSSTPSTSSILQALLTRPSTSTTSPAAPTDQPSRPSTSTTPPPSHPSTSPAPPPPTVEEDLPVIHLSDDDWQAVPLSTDHSNFWDTAFHQLVVEELAGTGLPQNLTLPSSPPSSPPGAHLPATPRSSIGSPLPPAPTSLLSPLPSTPAPASPLGAHLPATPSPPASPLGAHLPATPSPPASPLAPGAPHTMPRRRITRRQLWSNWCYRVWRWERTGNHNTVFLFDVGNHQILELPLPRSIRPTRAQREHHLFTSHIYLRKVIINGRSFITFNP